VSIRDLKGEILGFEEYCDYTLEALWGDESPFRLLACTQDALSFVVVNPYHVLEDYSFEVEDDVIGKLKMEGSEIDSIAVLCIVRPNEKVLYVNLRSPLIINIKNGAFCQVILQNDSYGVSVPFAAKKDGE